jgi:hypothetical protein
MAVFFFQNSGITARITWTRQYIRQLLEDKEPDSNQEVIDRFLYWFRPYAYQHEILDKLEAK